MGLDLCVTPQASKPYFIENISTNIFSIEELCFYLHENVCLIDQSIMNEALCDWIRDELGMKRLYRQLYEQLEGEMDVEHFVLPIFREIGYLDPKQMKEFHEQLTRLTVQPEDERQKLKGDYLVRCGMFESAAAQYRSILDRRGPGRASTEFYSGIWNNLGCAYARMFRFEDAAESFLRAWNEVHTKETMRKYVSVLPLFLDEQQYRRKLKELGADRQLTHAISQYNAQICDEARVQTLRRRESRGYDRNRLRQLKEEYRRSVNCLLSQEDSD